MGKCLRFFALALCFTVLLTGCTLSLETFGLGKLDALFTDSPIVCRVTSVQSMQVSAEVLVSDGTYDEGDTLVLDCTDTMATFIPRVGNFITFTYDYMTGVTVQNNDPYIRVLTMAPTQYTPPATEAPTVPTTLPPETAPESSTATTEVVTEPQATTTP